MKSTGLIIALTNCRSDEEIEISFSWGELGISEDEFDNLSLDTQNRFIDLFLETYVMNKFSWRHMKY